MTELEKTKSAKPWIGKQVETVFGGGWGKAGYVGIARERAGCSLAEGWFELVNDDYPDGILAHTQEFVRKDF